jgi:hypothetical protein
MCLENLSHLRGSLIRADSGDKKGAQTPGLITREAGSSYVQKSKKFGKREGERTDERGSQERQEARPTGPTPIKRANERQNFSKAQERRVRASEKSSLTRHAFVLQKIGASVWGGWADKKKETGDQEKEQNKETTEEDRKTGRAGGVYWLLCSFRCSFFLGGRAEEEGRVWV